MPPYTNPPFLDHAQAQDQGAYLDPWAAPPPAHAQWNAPAFAHEPASPGALAYAPAHQNQNSAGGSGSGAHYATPWAAPPAAPPPPPHAHAHGGLGHPHPNTLGFQHQNVSEIMDLAMGGHGHAPHPRGAGGAHFSALPVPHLLAQTQQGQGPNQQQHQQQHTLQQLQQQQQQHLQQQQQRPMASMPRRGHQSAQYAQYPHQQQQQHPPPGAPARVSPGVPAQAYPPGSPEFDLGLYGSPEQSSSLGGWSGGGGSGGGGAGGGGGGSGGGGAAGGSGSYFPSSPSGSTGTTGGHSHSGHSHAHGQGSGQQTHGGGGSGSVTSSPVVPGPAPGAKGKGKKKARVQKRARPDDGDEDEDDEDDVDSPTEPGAAKGSAGHRACARCKKAKIRCSFAEGESVCRKCKSQNAVCVIEKRKPPRNPNKREYFLAQIKEKDAIIETLLKELYNPYSATPLSVQSFRDSAPRGEGANTHVVAWLSRLSDGAQPVQPNRFFVPGSSAPVRTASGPETGDTSYRTAGTGDDDDEDADEEAGDGSTSSSRGTHRVPGEDTQSPLDESYPIAQIADLRISQGEGRATDRASDVSGSATAFEEHEGVGIPNPQYFKPGPAADLAIRAKLVAEHSKAELLTHGLVNESDVDTLFEIYHKQLNSFVPLLDPYIHTPRETFSRCPCLFTVICAITSRYYPEKADIYPIAMHFAKNEAANALMHGWKSVELSQAFILLAMYSHPARRWEEERSYLYGGLAMRIAVDLNLHVTPTTKPKNEMEDREVLNRMRLWMICFETDYTMAAHYGKPASLKENHIIRSSDTFYTRSPHNLVADIHLSAYNKLLRLIAAFHGEVYSDPDSRTGLRKSLDFATVTIKYDKEMDALVEVWQQKFGEFKKFENNPVYDFRQLLLPYVVNYSKLIMWSFGFQKAFEKGMKASDQFFFTKCSDAARGVVRSFVDVLAPSGYMRYAPNGWFNFCSFASAFLMKLLRPDFASFLSAEDEDEIASLITRLVKAMSSSEVAIDDRHTPKLWARFLEDLLNKHRRDGGAADITPSQSAPQAAPHAHGGAVAASFPLSASMHVFQVQPAAPAAAQQQQATTSPTSAGPLTHPQAFAFDDADLMAGQLGFVPDVSAAFGPGAPGYVAQHDMGGAMTVDDDSTISPMAALSNPMFWENMMMPGFVWPDSPSSVGDLPVVDYPQPQPGAEDTWY